MLVELAAIGAFTYTRPAPPVSTAVIPFAGNTEQVGWMLYTSYLIPFEIASMLLLVAMIGAIVLAKREL
jgi:NADH-quinone oxidoreductase subunit J